MTSFGRDAFSKTTILTKLFSVLHTDQVSRITHYRPPSFLIIHLPARASSPGHLRHPCHHSHARTHRPEQEGTLEVVHGEGGPAGAGAEFGDLGGGGALLEKGYRYWLVLLNVYGIRYSDYTAAKLLKQRWDWKQRFLVKLVGPDYFIFLQWLNPSNLTPSSSSSFENLFFFAILMASSAHL